MNAAIILARGGSKRIHKKNIKSFHGKPIIAYSIEAAKKTNVFDKVIVSTDSEEIAKTAKKYGAEVPFMRPKEISDDETPTAPVLVHAIDWLTNNSEKPSFVCCIYATAPFLKAKYLKRGFEFIQNKECTSSFSVTTYAFPIHRSLELTKQGHVRMVWPEFELTRSQDLPERYHDAGQFYWLDCDKFLHNPKMYTDNSIPVLLPRYLVQDIDTEEDWVQAEKMFTALNL